MEQTQQDLVQPLLNRMQLYQVCLANLEHMDSQGLKAPQDQLVLKAPVD